MVLVQVAHNSCLCIFTASNPWQVSPIPPPSLPSGSFSTSTSGPTAATGMYVVFMVVPYRSCLIVFHGDFISVFHIAAKKQKRETNILRCGRCRQPRPPRNPQGLVLWVQCDNCHKLFHTICVSSEMDLDDDEFWCFWCLDVWFSFDDVLASKEVQSQNKLICVTK